MHSTDKSLKLTPKAYELLRRIAEAERRNLRGATEHALIEYAKRHVPAVLAEVYEGQPA